jgi:2-amino-4-hydroxy-6-hydroxymethyldihydropteridine diphosphokinase
VSRLYESEPWGGAAGGNFTNAVLEIACTGEAHVFLRLLQSVEVARGRARREVNEPRTCDLDLLLWGADSIDTPELVVPHSRLAQRRFVLVPLCEVIPDGIHPRWNRTFRELLEICPDVLRVRRVGATNLF